MSPLIWRGAILLTLGAALGSGMTARHYRTQLDALQDQLSNAVTARDNLKALTHEQGLALGRLVQAGRDRERLAALAMQQAREEARSDYEAASRLQLERTGGDPARAAAFVIDQELGL
ncbi:hypothetical protein M2401_001102 [Pseudomonas sp. JUb42]|uniref:hypothetical protein n=1 Tax=Pseudomonas sp. JUb42 TaxID=2940611 RepID=UPI002167B157|nr:hypothetical protein [Pseudomonas sp. JUb42]MCS3467381.1 hypothetical protein [Pseudomonas sp. JUb42]